MVVPWPLPPLTPCLSMASRSNCTTSWPSTPLHLKPLVQEMRVLWGQKSGVTPTAFTGRSPSPAIPTPAPPHLVQARLVTREAEVEPKLQALAAQGVCIQEFRQAASHKVKELGDTEGLSSAWQGPSHPVGPQPGKASSPADQDPASLLGGSKTPGSGAQSCAPPRLSGSPTEHAAKPPWLPAPAPRSLLALRTSSHREASSR